MQYTWYMQVQNNQKHSGIDTTAKKEYTGK